MIFTDPIPFQEAVDQLKKKGILPTELNSKELLAHTSADLRERSFFSSRVINADLLQEFKDGVSKIVNGTSDEATQRLHFKNLLDSIGYNPEPGTEGGLQDLGSNKRLNLILNTNVSMVRGFGQWMQGNEEGALDAFPAQELIRVSPRAVPREWFEIWDDAADELGDATTASDADDSGRMVAMKNDPIWEAISDFGLPYPPFKFNSGMGVEDVSYEEAVELGVMDPDDDPIEPEPRGMNDDLQASVDGLDDDIAGELVRGFSEAVHIVKGVLGFKNEAQEIRDRGNAVLTLLANSGTHDGGIKGWETRRIEGSSSPRRTERVRIARQIKAGRAALKRSLKTGSDQNDALRVPGAGTVDFIYGRPGNPKAKSDDGYGISHLEAKHPEAMPQLPRTLAKGTVYPHDDADKRYVVHGTHVAVLQKKYRGDGTPMQSRFGVLTHFTDARKARQLTGLSNTSQVLLADFLSRQGYSLRPTGNADRSGCCQEFQLTGVPVFRQSQHLLEEFQWT